MVSQWDESHTKEVKLGSSANWVNCLEMVHASYGSGQHQGASKGLPTHSLLGSHSKMRIWRTSARQTLMPINRVPVKIVMFINRVLEKHQSRTLRPAELIGCNTMLMILKAAIGAATAAACWEVAGKVSGLSVRHTKLCSSRAGATAPSFAHSGYTTHYYAS